MLAGVTGRAEITHFALTGRALIGCHLFSRAPGVRGVDFSFVGPPTVDVQFSPLAGARAGFTLTDLPGVLEIIQVPDATGAGLFGEAGARGRVLRQRNVLAWSSSSAARRCPLYLEAEPHRILPAPAASVHAALHDKVGLIHALTWTMMLPTEPHSDGAGKGHDRTEAQVHRHDARLGEVSNQTQRRPRRLAAADRRAGPRAAVCACIRAPDPSLSRQ